MCGITSGAVKIETTFFVRFPVPDVTPYVVDSADIRQITQLVYLLIANGMNKDTVVNRLMALE